MTPWRNGSASDSRSEGCVFESRRGQSVILINSNLCHCNYFYIIFRIKKDNETGEKSIF